jgi:hypothetical protein
MMTRSCCCAGTPRGGQGVFDEAGVGPLTPPYPSPSSTPAIVPPQPSYPAGEAASQASMQMLPLALAAGQLSGEWRFFAAGGCTSATPLVWPSQQPAVQHPYYLKTDDLLPRPPPPRRTSGESAAAKWEAGDGPAEPSLPGGVTLHSLGNHRVRLRCPVGVAAVLASPEWRRPDAVPASHGVFVTASASARAPILNASALNISRLNGQVAFDTRGSNSTGDFYVYWLPFTRNHLGQWGAVAVSYDRPVQTASAAWLAETKASIASLPRCTVISYEARDSFDRFTAMEVVATSSEMAALAAAAHEAPFLVVPESRDNPVRDFQRLPSRFLPLAAAAAARRCGGNGGSGSGTDPLGCDGTLPRFQATARPGEFFVFQLVVWALAPLHGVHVIFEPLQAEADPIKRHRCIASGFAAAGCAATLRLDPAAMSCINTGGTSYLGKPFEKHLNVTSGQVQPLYIGIDVPANLTSGATTLRGAFTVMAEDPSHSVAVQVELQVAGPVLQDHGDDNPLKLSRVRWLDSTVGIDNEPPLGFGSLQLDESTNTIRGNGKTIVIERLTGLPSRIAVDRESRRNRKATTAPLEVLASPVSLQVQRLGSSGAVAAVQWCPDDTVGGFHWTLQANGVVHWRARAVSCPSNEDQPGLSRLAPALQLEVNGTLEFDGYMDYAVQLNCGEGKGSTCELASIVLSIEMSGTATRYASGLGERGTPWPPPQGQPGRLWTWASATNATAHSVEPVHGWLGWVGAVSHGLRLKLKGTQAIWEQPDGFSPLMPSGWAASNGTLSLSTDKQAVLSARSGRRTLLAGESVPLIFDLVTSPVKKRDLRHFSWRYLMGCGGCDYPGGRPCPTYNVTKIGVNLVILHQGCDNNPYINWPWGDGPNDTFPADRQAFVDDRHSKGVRTLLYYTTRELSNRAAEMPVLRSLGYEILVNGDTSKPGGIPAIPGGAAGVSWLQEHLRSNYTTGWTTLVRENKTDAAIKDEGASRWANYYVQVSYSSCCSYGRLDSYLPALSNSHCMLGPLTST